MTAKIFVDTNILVYAHDLTAGEKHQQARDLILALWDSRDGCLSVQVLQEFYVTVTQKVARPMKPAAAVDIIRSLSSWTIHQPRADDVIQAVDLQQRYQLAFWDAMIIQSALQSGCSQIWSEDLNAGQNYAGVALINPL